MTKWALKLLGERDRQKGLGNIVWPQVDDLDLIVKALGTDKETLLRKDI